MPSLSKKALEKFAELIRAETGFSPANWDEVVATAIEKFNSKEEE